MAIRNARIMAMKILYLNDFHSQSLKSAIDFVMEDQTDELAISFVEGTMNRLEEIDALIESTLKNYHMDRLNLVDKAILRLATYELLEGHPLQVVINEALEITREFSDTGDHKAIGFNNGILDQISKKISR